MGKGDAGETFDIGSGTGNAFARRWSCGASLDQMHSYLARERGAVAFEVFLDRIRPRGPEMSHSAFNIMIHDRSQLFSKWRE